MLQDELGPLGFRQARGGSGMEGPALPAGWDIHAFFFG